MKLHKLKKLLNNIPEEFNDFEIACSEYLSLGEDHVGRVDRPIKEVLVDEDTREIVFVNDVPEDLLSELRSINHTVSFESLRNLPKELDKGKSLLRLLFGYVMDEVLERDRFQMARRLHAKYDY